MGTGRRRRIKLGLAMDLLHFLNDRLKFALYLYDSTVPAFEETKRKIEADEPPYESLQYPEDDEQPFQDDWERADLAVDVIGMSCLGLVKIALHTFLKDFVRRTLGKDDLAQVSKFKKGNWLANFRALFATSPDFDWEQSGADLDFLEEIVLTRNDFEHDADLIAQITYQDDSYAKKFPESRFRHPSWPKPFLRNHRLTVTRERLAQSVDNVRRLAEHIVSAKNPELRRHLNAGAKAEAK
jgi:hypothetical protein